METAKTVKKGEIYFADLGQVGNNAISNKRPVLILGNDKANEHSPLVTVLPISANKSIANYLPTHVTINSGLLPQSIILPERILTISKTAIISDCIYCLTENEIAKAENALKIQLGIT
jgi:mRNA interferase MazF